ncbi:MAG TPA: hypothetical protein VFQ35_15645, partial [Polyangiaceae bacterium]|nr:hypothetical protein [Polyangiaceae bacterium]
LSLEDTRGAILVVGLVLGFALALAVHTLVGVDSAVLDRETVQSAADAAAFESAVWHARGMNSLAGLNVLLALVLATLVFWRLATFAVGLAVLLESVALVQQPGSARTQIRELTPFAELLEYDGHVAGSVLLAASGLRDAEAAVAAYTPVLAAHAAALHTRESYDVVARTFSASLLPNVQTSAPAALAACLRVAAASSNESGTAADGESRSGGTDLSGLRQRAEEDVTSMLAFAERGPALPSASARLGMPFSLPVEVGANAMLCERATEVARDGEPVHGAPPSIANALNANEHISGRKQRALVALGVTSKEERLRRLGEALSGVLDAKAPAAFCASTGAGVDALHHSMAKLASDLREYAADDRTRTMLARLGSGRATLLGGPQSLEEARAIWSAWRRALEAGGDPSRCIRPVEVWSPARNGTGFFRSASAVAMPTAPFGLRSPGEVGASVDFRATAHAETFFDCEDSWDRCRGNALWEPSWSARLRRVRSFGALLDAGESTPNFTVADANVMARWVERLARRIGQPRVLFDVLAERAELEVEPDPVARTWSVGLLQAQASAQAQRPLAGFVARHAKESSIVH